MFDERVELHRVGLPTLAVQDTHLAAEPPLLPLETRQVRI